MDHFLVDYENIGEAGLKGIENLGSDTSTVIFYSEHADKISFDMHQVLCRCLSKLEFRKAETGKKNALDFQLSTYLGYLVASHPGDRFFIISKDNGYRVVMDFWNKNTIQQLDYIGRAYERPTKPNSNPSAQSEPRADKAPAANTSAEKTPAANTALNTRAEKAPAANTAANAPAEKTMVANTPAEKAPTAKAPAADIAAHSPAEKAPVTNTAANTPAEKVPIEKAPAPNAAANAPTEKTPATNTAANAPAEKAPAGEAPAEGRTRRGGRRRNSGPKEPAADEKPSPELMNALSQLIDGEEERENIGRFIVKYKTKQGVNNAIVKIYGTEKAGELYKKIKPLLKDKKGK